MTDKHAKDWKKVREEAERFIDEDEDGDGDGTPSVNALDHADYKTLEDKLTLAEQQAHENWEKSVRALAEVDNIRRRAERDVARAHLYGKQEMIESLLPVVDSLEQALQFTEDNGKQAMAEGVQLTLKLLLDVLQKYDVIELNPIGELFNPEEHEAMSVQESEDAVPNSILTVFQKGYKLNDRLIRPARVIVAKLKA
jgi:molecular chaperone GrpE